VTGVRSARGHARLYALRDLTRAATVPTPWLLSALGAVLASGTTLGLIALRSAPSGPAALAVLPALAGSLGAVLTGADFRYGSLPAEIMLCGGKARYFVRQIAVTAPAGAGAAAFMAGAAATIAVVLGHRLADPAVFVAVAGAAGAGWSLIGCALAVSCRGQTGAVTALLIYLLMVEPVLQTTTRALSAWLPGAITARLLAVSGSGFADAIRFTVVTAVLCAAALAVFFRRDVEATPRLSGDCDPGRKKIGDQDAHWPDFCSRGGGRHRAVLCGRGGTGIIVVAR
jgi:ABC-2 type transport system permease protein